MSDKYLGALMVASKDAVFVEGSGKAILRIDATNPAKQDEKTLPEGPSALTLRGPTLYGSAQPELADVIIGVDQVTLAEQSRVELPFIVGFQQFVFVD